MEILIFIFSQCISYLVGILSSLTKEKTYFLTEGGEKYGNINFYF